MSRRRDPYGTRAAWPSPAELRKELLPDAIERPKRLQELNDAASEAIDRFEQARMDAVSARRAAEVAPRADQAELIASHERGDSAPRPTAAEKREQAQAARTIVGHTLDKVDAALEALAAGILERQDELTEAGAVTLGQEASETLAELDALAASFHRLASASGNLARLHSYNPHSEYSKGRRFERALLQPGGVKVMDAIADLRRAAQTLQVHAVPYRQQILELVGEDGADWDTICERLGVNPIDSTVRGVRNSMVREGILTWRVQDGVRRLVSSTPRESQLARAFRERRERQAQAA